MLLISSTLFCLHKAVVRQVVFPRVLKQRIFPAFDGAFFLTPFSSCAMQCAGFFFSYSVPPCLSSCNAAVYFFFCTFVSLVLNHHQNILLPWFFAETMLLLSVVWF